MTPSPLKAAIHAAVPEIKVICPLYARISKEIGKTYHTGEADEDICRKVLDLDIALTSLLVKNV